MKLALAPAGVDDAFRWWSVTSRVRLRAPIIGIELRVARDAADQWLLSDHGVRQFRYQGRRVVQAGPPVPTFPSREGLIQVQQWLRSYLPLRAPDYALPASDLEGLDSMLQVLEIADRRWGATRTDPPAGMTPELIAAEMEAFPHGIKELLAVTE